MGIDLACRAAHVASLAGPDGTLVWRGRSFYTRPADLEKLWRDLACDDPAELTVVMEPTRNAWIPVAAWFRRRGARVVLVPTRCCQMVCVSGPSTGRNHDECCDRYDESFEQAVCCRATCFAG